MRLIYKMSYIKKRRSHSIKPFQPFVLSSKLNQVCFPLKSKSFQEIKSQNKLYDFEKNKYKKDSSIDDIKLDKSFSIDIESLTFSPTNLSSPTSQRFDTGLKNSHQYHRYIGNNLDYQISQLKKFTFNPVPRESLYPYIKMTEESKVNEENINMTLESQNEEELIDYADSDRSHLQYMYDNNDDDNDDDNDDGYNEKDEETTEKTYNDESEMNGDKNETETITRNSDYDYDEEEEEEEENFLEDQNIIDEAEISSFDSKTTHEKVMESMVSDSIITKISEADETKEALEKEIEELQKEIKARQNKEDATDIDHEILQQKKSNLLNKMKTLDLVTKKIEEDLGLDSSPSHNFSSEFVSSNFQPDLKRQETVESKIDRWKAWENDNKDELESPQQSYPEDKLPRVIICGRTEYGIPRIVIAGAPEEVNKNVKNTENVADTTSNSQEGQKNSDNGMVQLKNDTLKIQEAQQEENHLVRNLQKTICDLQVEMNMLMRNNEKLSQQIIFLNQQIGYPNCPIDYLSNSPRFNPNSSNNPDYCNDICAHLKQKKLNNNSQRLSGGGSGENICCFSPLSPNSKQNKLMASSRGPTLISVSKIEPPSQACPAEAKNKLMNCGSDTKLLEQKLMTMHHMKLQIESTQRERHQLQQQSKLLKCTAPCAPCSCSNSGNAQSPLAFEQGILSPYTIGDFSRNNKPMAGTIPSCTGPCTNASPGTSDCILQQLRDLREQYSRLQEDYKNKLKEVSYHRTITDKMKQDVREAINIKEKTENEVIDLQERLKMFESDKNKYNGSKEQIMEQEHMMIVMKQRYRESQDELEELRALIQDQANQLEDYRNKYLQAQEQVEEQKRQLDLMEMDNARMNDNVTLEIGRVKNQFQEKLAELAPLPDILKQTQIKLQECQQKLFVAERNSEELTKELLSCRDKIGAMTSQSEMLKSENVLLKGSNPDQLDDLENSNRELRNENERLRNAVTRFEEREAENKRKLDEKAHEIVQLTSMLEQIREDSARQVNRTKERCDTVRKSMQAQIGELEIQLVQCRAAAKSAQKDRDEIRQKMQGQLNHLQENFNFAQGRIRTLQGHVNYLKTSYSNIFNPIKPDEDQMNSSLQSLPLNTNTL